MISDTSEDHQPVSAAVGGGSSTTKIPTLLEYGTNLTKLAEEVAFYIRFDRRIMLQYKRTFQGQI
jgi:hypothetical protein